MFGRDKNDQEDSSLATYSDQSTSRDSTQNYSTGRSTVVPINTPGDSSTQVNGMSNQSAPVLSNENAGSDYILTNSSGNSNDSATPSAISPAEQVTSNNTISSDNSLVSQGSSSDLVTDIGSSSPGDSSGFSGSAIPANIDLPNTAQDSLNLPAPSNPTGTAAASTTALAVSSEPLTVSSITSPVDSSDLQNIKHQALKQLSPLVNYLDQTSEDKFRTTMMMLQATDDQSLIKVAYEAAQGINDDKVRAQALLDVVNEINYFTQQGQK